MPASPDAAILRNLRGGFVPGEELGDPAEIAARIALLIEAGYEIEHHPHRGYHLLSSPDRLIADDILSRLPEGGWIRDVLVFEKTGSTNDVVGSLARQGAPAGLAVFAEEQTAGEAWAAAGNPHPAPASGSRFCSVRKFPSPNGPGSPFGSPSRSPSPSANLPAWKPC